MMMGQEDKFSFLDGNTKENLRLFLLNRAYLN